ncbi:MAG: UspA protein [Fluviicola sp.]|jgi:nucleotide-binding universal stress UspA family protein|uniref:universal stress protein n=1 Tax=Fluviicola sp. TaxID=1917219 RepID=UPI002601F6C3|nr:universal stress protein [Fluviicola sp.]MDF3027236.1 UspA protein [Fluviicola sp.]
MKKILVPTDFSILSDNALDYAVQLAKKTGAELLLFHVYFVPASMYDPLLIIPSEQELEKETKSSLEKLKEKILKTNPDAKISYHTVAGAAYEEIICYAEKEKVDFIVIGNQGAGYLEERVLGSTASLLIRESKIPVMVIRKEVKFKEPKNFVLAVDFVETDNKTVLKPLKQLARLFKSHVQALNIYTESKVIPTFGEIAEGFRLIHSLKFIHHTFFYRENKDVVAGINDFVAKHDIDMVVMITREHSAISRLFREPHTKAMAFRTKVPLLTLHE